jgi:23S rRNA A2030 N6-methylase RlmJ
MRVRLKGINSVRKRLADGTIKIWRPLAMLKRFLGFKEDLTRALKAAGAAGVETV